MKKILNSVLSSKNKNIKNDKLSPPQYTITPTPTNITINIQEVIGATNYELFINNIIVYSGLSLFHIFETDEQTTYSIAVRASSLNTQPSITYSVVTTPAKFGLPIPVISGLTTTETTIIFSIENNGLHQYYDILLNDNVIYDDVLPINGGTLIVLSGLTGNTEYNIKVRSFTNDPNFVPFSTYENNVLTDTPNNVINTPTLFSQESTISTISIIINSTPNATLYEYYLNNVLSETTNSLNKTFSGLTDETLYEIKVIATASGYTDSNPLILNISTNSLDGQRIEDFGGDPIYSLHYNELNITPLTGESKSLITFTGLGNPFESDWVSKNVEFVLFEGHKNSSDYPINGVINGNYTPSLFGSRYSKVVDFIDGKNVKVNFVYNGGNLITPQSQTDKSGYFFFDNRNAFKNAFNLNTSRTEKIYLKGNKTYVTKGGWDSEIRKTLHLLSDTNSSSIKISMEDTFSLDNLTGVAYNFNVASLFETYGSGNFFKLTNLNDMMDINIENIDILPPHYTPQTAQFNSSHTTFALFSQDANAVGLQRQGINRLYNSNGFKEKTFLEENPKTFTRQPNFSGIQFGFSNDGGKINIGTNDISTYQEFILENSKWQSPQFHNIKFNQINGNFLKILGTPLNKSEVYITDISLPNEVQLSIRVEQDEFSKNRLLKHNSDFSFYFGANQNWFGNGVNNVSTFTNTSDRLQYIRVPYLGQTYYFFQPNQASIRQAFGGVHGEYPTIRSGNEIIMFEEVPVSNTSTFVIDGTINKKISNTEFDVFGWGLQARLTYPSYNDNLGPNMSGTLPSLPNGDIIRFNGTDYEILERKRIVAHGPNPIENTVGWRIKLSAPITATNPDFLVVNSRSEFILNSYVTAYVKFKSVGTYFCYGSYNLNFIFENVKFNGFGRFTDNPKNSNNTNHTYSLSTPKYLLPTIQRFTNAEHTGLVMQWEGVNSDGLEWRNKIEGVNTYRVVIDNSRLWWQRLNDNKSLVEFKNTPRIMDGATFGEARILDPIFDGTGAILEGGASFCFTNKFPLYNLSNIFIENSGINDVKDLYIWGNGNVNISNFNSELINTLDYAGINYNRANGFPSIPNTLTVTGNTGYSGFYVNGTFTSNTLILTNWTIRRFQYNSSGWGRGDTSWPTSPTVTFPNFSITGPV